jgi:Fe-S-cluster containining protein
MMPVVLCLSKSRAVKSPDANSLCLECGLCCNGVIFADGQLQPEDDAVRLRALGLKLAPTRNSELGTRKFFQPCAAFDGCRCNIYSERPKYCRQFECLLLKNVKAGKIETNSAVQIIRTALRRAKKVKQLLRELGDSDEQTALSKRFRRMKRQVESGALDETTAQTFGELTLAVHDLNLLIGEAFYPG